MIPHPSEPAEPALARTNGFTKLDSAERARISTALRGMQRGAPAPRTAKPDRKGQRYLLFLPICLLAAGGIYLMTGDRDDTALAAGRGADVVAGTDAPPAPAADATAETAAAAPAAATPQVDGAPIALEASGTVVAKRVATVSSSVTGRLAEIFVEEGDRVVAGQPIALLDTNQAQRSIRTAEARVRAAEAAAEVADAKAHQTRISLDRTNLLADRGLVPQQDLQDLVALDGVSQAEVRAHRQQIDVQHEEVEIAKQAIDDATIRAPFSGIVTELNANLGEIISPLSSGGFTRTGVGTIVDFSSLLAEVDVGEQYLGKLRENQKVQLETPAFSDARLDGHIKLITPNVDPATAAVKVSIAFDEPDARIFPGMRVDASFLEPGRD